MLFFVPIVFDYFYRFDYPYTSDKTIPFPLARVLFAGEGVGGEGAIFTTLIVKQYLFMEFAFIFYDLPI